MVDLNTLAEIVGIGAAASLGGYALLVEQFNIQVRNIELRLPNLPNAFDGYTILHLSDLHINKLGMLEKRTMELIGQREVDACIITGDVTTNPRASDTFRRVCSAIKHRDPIYMVLGNSEHKPWVDTQTLTEALSFPGLNILINSSMTINRGTEKITLVGIDDPYSRLDDIEKAYNGVDSDDFIIFLTHCPSKAPDGIKRGADLILSGHTHGGQVRLPYIGVLWTHMRSNKKLNDGLYMPDDLKRILKTDPGDSILYVSRGVGTSRIHIRFLCPPEITYITLRKA